jgi:glycosyltransferase involved in cell wall biosynthesis
MDQGLERPAARAGTPQAEVGLPVAYLVNQYPKVSHSFIRREILALERRGVAVERLALRGWDAEVVDADDIAEQKRTRYVLAKGLLPVAGSVLSVAIRRPAAFLRALKAALAMGRHSVRPLPYHLVYLGHACRLLGWVEERPVRHLHAHFGTNAAEVAALLAILGGPDYSFTVHGADEADNALRLSLGTKTAGARFVVAISNYTRAQLMRHVAPADWSKIRVVHCGLEPAFFDERPAEPIEPPTLLCIGRLSGEKGHLVLVKAFARLRETHPEARLVLAGDGEMRKEIEAAIAARGQTGAVRITGWIDAATVRAELAAATVLVQPSFQEGLPVVIMEAMALRRPVISTYVAGIPELVRPGETGWLVPAGAPGPLAEAMADCLGASRERRAEMGEAAHARVRERHSVDAEAARLEALFAGEMHGDGARDL